MTMTTFGDLINTVDMVLVSQTTFFNSKNVILKDILFVAGEALRNE